MRIEQVQCVYWGRWMILSNVEVTKMMRTEVKAMKGEELRGWKTHVDTSRVGRIASLP